MIVLIDGYWGTGKSVLRGLLDGHPNLFVSPIQDSLPGSFAKDKSDKKWLEFKDVEYLRKILAQNSFYYRIERFYFNQKMQLDFSSKDRTYININIDFYLFDKQWMERLNVAKHWTEELICQEIYQSMLDNWDNYPSEKSAVNHFVSMDNNFFGTPEYFLKNFKDAKLLYAIRSVEGIIATRANRRPIKEDYRTLAWETISPDSLIKGGEIFNILKRTRNIRRLKEVYPERVHLVGFNDLILNTDQVMNGVAEFLEIDRSESLKIFSHLGKEITADGKKYVGKIHDQPEDLLTKNQFDSIKFVSESKSRIIRLIKNPLIIPNIAWIYSRKILSSIYHRLK